MNVIDSFFGDYRFLSNFWKVDVYYEGLIYPSVEHAYQAAKTLERKERLVFTQIPNCAQAKKFGRNLTLRHDWDEVKLKVMKELLDEKFSFDDLAWKLLATGDAELIEGNDWNDTYWGVCKGIGENHLGKLLMEKRAELRGQ